MGPMEENVEAMGEIIGESFLEMMELNRHKCDEETGRRELWLR